MKFLLAMGVKYSLASLRSGSLNCFSIKEKESPILEFYLTHVIINRSKNSTAVSISFLVISKEGERLKTFL